MGIAANPNEYNSDRSSLRVRTKKQNKINTPLVPMTCIGYNRHAHMLLIGTNIFQNV